MIESQTLLDDPRGLASWPTHRLYRDRLLPWLIVPLAWLYSLALLPAYLLGFSRRRANAQRPAHVVIESGRIGWTQVFFEELHASAAEFFGEGAVQRASIDREESYHPQFHGWIREFSPTHAVIDVRTPPQSWSASLREAFRVSWSLHRLGIYPIVILTDAFYRRQRWHAAVLTAWQGRVVTFACRSIVRPVFPHSRIDGPLIMPISRGRIDRMQQARPDDSVGRKERCTVAFVGNVYPPRSTFLDLLADELAHRDLYLTVHGDKFNRSNEDYWEVLRSADIIVTTTMQGPDRNYIDWNWVRQAVHRFSETLAAGTAVVGAPVDGGFPPFVPGRDWMEFGSVRQAADVIEDLANDPDLRGRIAAQGHATYIGMVDSGSFWKVALGSER